MFTYKFKFILLSQLIATQTTMHVHCIHCLMSTGLFFHRAFANHVSAQLVKWHRWRTQIWQWGPKMAPTVSARLSRPCSGILALHVDFIATLNSTVCVILFFGLAFATTASPLRSSCPPPYIRWPNNNEFHEKLSKTGENQPLSTCNC